MELDVSVDGGLLSRVRLGVFALEGVGVREGDPALAAEVDGYCAELRTRYGDGKSAEVPGAAHFSFQTPYPPALAAIPPAQDPPGFDRAAYQPILHADITAFLRAPASGRG